MNFHAKRMSTVTPNPGRRRSTLSSLRHAGRLLTMSAASILVFLGASAEPVFTPTLITIEAAMEWNAYVSAGMANAMNLPGRPGFGSRGRSYQVPQPATHTAMQSTDGTAQHAAGQYADPADMPPSLSLISSALSREWTDVAGSAVITDPLAVDMELQDFAAALRDDVPAMQARVDSLDIPPMDSTTRAKFLPQRPRPSPLANPFPRRVSPLYGQPTGGIRRIVEVDSTKDEVLIREVVNGKDVRIPVRMSLEDYIRGRYNYEQQQRTAEKASEYSLEEGDDLENLLKNITEIDIPVAPNPLMSIFGDRSRISVRINGTIDINAGFKIETSDQQSVFLQPTQFSPNFKQQVQINVNGLVGDKLSIRADWSTERTFDYENQLKIKYTGYEDEIVQSVEAGNVSLQTPSTLIQGSGALFGLKAEFQLGPLRLATIASQKKGESSKLSINGGAQEQEFERHAFEYSDNHYFIEEQYRDVDPESGISPYEAFYNYRAEFNDANSPVVIRPDLYIKDIEVWLSRPTTSGVVTDPEEREVVAFIDLGSGPNQLTPYNPGDADFPASYEDLLNPNERVNPESGKIEVGKFKRIQQDVDYSYNPQTGIITLNQSIQDDQVIAVAYRIENDADGAVDDLIYGTFAGDQRLNQDKYDFEDEDGEPIPPRMVLKLVKPKNLGPSFEHAWKLKVRSIYSLNTRNLTAEDLANFKIVYRSGGQPDEEILPNTNANLIRLFGLDYTDNNGGPPDGKIDFIPGETVNPIRGEIIFPTLEPWNEGMKDLYAKLYGGSRSDMDPYVFPEIYTQTKTQARQSSNDKIIITGRTRGSSSAVYNLGFNVVPGSVRVLLNGQPLTPGVDYTVDEQVGTVRITKEEALVPEAKVDIEYEKQDLFTFASKTLLGARGEVDLGDNAYFGFTWMSLNQKTLSDKVRIGEEPISNSMFGVDAKTTIDAPVLTEALNTLPFLSTKEKSTLTLQGEAAMVMPQKSSKTSTIPSDNGEGIAYLDDFEGSRIFIPLQTAYSVWRLGSVPPFLPGTPAAPDTVMQTYRAKLDWYNVPITSFTDKTVRVEDIWPEKSVGREEQRVTVLDLDYFPQRRGQYNYTPNLGNERRNWAGMMRLLPVNATNLVDGNYNYIEMWMKVENGSGGKLIIDLGKISEDVIPNGKLNSEDDVLAESIRNGILNPGEDVGLDMLTDAEEQAEYADEIAQGLIPAGDPSGDNFAYNPDDWTQFNGTQGNIDDPAGQFPDTEDLNNNSILDLTNDFYRYVIDLDTTRFDPAGSINNPHPYVVGGGTKGWYQFRIPLAQPDDSVGAPSLDNVEYMRVMFNDIETANDQVPFNVRIAEFNFVGNQWYERKRNDPYMAVSVVNIEDNPNEYTTPPGVIRPRDRTRPDQEIYGNEQSLSLDLTELPEDSLRETYRIFPGNGIDLFNYRQLKMYVHGDRNLPDHDYEFVMRFGIDTANYYEYRAPIEPGWSSNNEVAINFADLTAVKNLIDSTSTYDQFPVPGKPGAFFWVKGNPDVVRVQFISVGVRNLDDDPLTGRVWVNELRVIEPNTKNGYAYNASMNLRLADIADVNATINHSDPHFHGISERFSATRAYTTNWSMTTTLNLDKALPESWQGTQMRVTYTHSENLTKPLLVPGQPDVEVEAMVSALTTQLRQEGASQREIEEAVRNARIATQTLSIRDSWAIPTIKLKMPGESWLIQDVINRLELSYNYNITRERNTIFRSRRNWQWQARIGYGYDFGRESYVEPFSIFDGIPILEFYKDAKWFYLPSRISANAALERSRLEEVDRDPYRVRPYVRSFTHNRAANLAVTLSEESLLNLSGSYGTNIRTSLLGLETYILRDENGDPVLDQFNLPIVRQRQSSAIFNDIFFGRNGSLYFGIPTDYQQQVSLQSRPLIPPIFNLDRYLDLTMSYQVSYNWQQNIQQAEQGRSASYNASFNSQLNLKLKSLFDPLFESATPVGGPVTPERTPSPGRRSSRQTIEERNEKKAEKLDRAANLKAQPLSDILAQLKEEYPNADAEFLEEMRDMVEKEGELADLKRNPSGDEQLEEIVQLNDDVQNARRRLISMMTGDTPIPGVEASAEEGEDAGDGQSSMLARYLRQIALYGIKVPFLDYDNIGITFSQNTASQVGGVRGETGFSTFWGSVPFGNPPNADNGPSRLYQLGLISDPNPASGRLAFKSSFPFIGVEDYSRGLRAPNPNGQYTDNYSQNNTFSIKTNRPLWEGARLDLNWDLRWSINKNYQLNTDERGVQTIRSVTTTGKLERSFMAFPDFFLFSLFNTNMNAVDERYQELLSDPSDSRTETEKLAQAFKEGFEAVPWLEGILGNFFPRLNYGFRWDGLEKWSLLEGLADRISLEHRYTSNFSMSYRHSQDDGTRITENQQVSTGFKPLIGVQLAFNQVWGGDLSITTRWDKQGSFNLNTSASNIVEDNSDEFTLTAEFKKSGFEMPMFGLTLKNDIQFSFAFSLNKTSSRIYGITDLGSGGQPREGITRISLEPRVRYSVSQRVQASLFYRYQRTRPDEEVGSRIPGTTSHEGGLEVRITIAGS